MKSIIMCLFIAVAGNAVAKDHCDNHCQKSLIDDYYKKINRVLMSDSTPEHIDTFLYSLHDEVLYLHTEYQAEFNKDIWRNAFLRHMKLGRYTNSKDAGTTIKSIIYGHQTAAVEFISHYNDDETKALISTPPRLAIFKFKEDKIVFIQDHWYHAIE